jgi:hypothetical protein
MSRNVMNDSEIRKIHSIIEAQGFVISKTNSGHVRYLPPDPTMPIVIGAGTTCNKKGVRDLRARLRRSGAIL